MSVKHTHRLTVGRADTVSNEISTLSDYSGSGVDDTSQRSRGGMRRPIKLR